MGDAVSDASRGALEAVSLRFLDRYREVGVRLEELDYSRPLVVDHASVAEYVLGLNPRVSFDAHDVTAAVRRWHRLIKSFEELGFRGRLPAAGYAIGYLHPGVYVVSPSTPRLPSVPQWLALRVGTSTIIVRSWGAPEWRRFYTWVLKGLAHAVIVKPPPTS